MEILSRMPFSSAVWRVIAMQCRAGKCGTVIPHCDFQLCYMETLVFIRGSPRFPSRSVRTGAPKRAHMRSSEFLRMLNSK